MATIEPIRIFHRDSDEEVRARHTRIEAVLDKLGKDMVVANKGIGFPTQWDPIIDAWVAGGRLALQTETTA